MMKYGVIYNSVGNIRSSPNDRAELLSQTLLGIHVRIMEESGKWRRVQTTDKYIGWVNHTLTLMSKSELDMYLKHPKLIVTSLYAKSYEKADNQSQMVSDLVIGNRLLLKSEGDAYYEVEYPDGRKAFVRIEDAERESDWFKSVEVSGESLAKFAHKFMGIPYLWGGTSSKALDCSGLTHLVCSMHGITISRDASQQVHHGKLIDESGDFGEAMPGDLIFFGTKASSENPRELVVHVGFYIGNKRFVHASDNVHISSFDPDDPLYDDFNTLRYLRTKRIV